MASRILSVEVGNSITRICEMDFRTKNPKVYKYFSIPTPSDTLEDGFIKENAEFSLAFKRALSDNKIRTKQVVFSVTSGKIVTREVLVPTMKLNQVGAYVRANANDYFPIDLSMYELAHIVLGTDTGDDGKEKYRVMVMATGKDLISGYAKFAASCGLRMVTIDYAGNSIYQIMRSECGSEATLVIKMEDYTTIASVISGGNLMLQRTLANGVERALHALMESPEYYVGSYTEAFNTMCQKSCIKVALSDKTRVLEKDEVYGETEAESEARQKITESFGQLISNLVRVVGLYNSKSSNVAISQVILVGIGAEIKGLSKLLTNELGIPTKILKNISGTATHFQSLESEPVVGRYIGAIGATIAPVELAVADTKKSSYKKINYGRVSVLVGLLYVIIIGVLFVQAFVPYYTEIQEEQRLKALEATYAQAEVVHDQYVAMDAFHQDVKGKYLLTKHSNDELIAFLEEMEAKLPSDIIVQEFVSDAEKAVFTIDVIDLDEAGKVFQILREFESVRDVTIKEVTTVQYGENEENVVKRFDIECYYYPVGFFDDEENSQAEVSSEVAE